MAEDRETTETENGSNGSGSDGVGKSALDALKSKELLVPAVMSAAGAVAVAKGPDLVRRLTSATEEKGGEGMEQLGRKAAEGAKESFGNGSSIGGLAGKALSKAMPGGGGQKKKTRRLPIQRWTDVAVPVETAYQAWTKFDQFPKFMHRVLNVEREGNDKIRWEEKIWFSKRNWEGRITERRKNDRIAWKSTGGMHHSGVVTFHRLDDRLTRVMVDMEFEPTGMIEKMASGLRFVKRAVQADLARFKTYVEFEDAKGLEYAPAADENEGEDKDDDGDESGNESDRDSARERRRQERTARAGGS
jgi:uncharacterized membrane protein